jgi:hypothetical protein
VERDGEITPAYRSRNPVYPGVSPDGHAREVLTNLLDSGVVDFE